MKKQLAYGAALLSCALLLSSCDRFNEDIITPSGVTTSSAVVSVSADVPDPHAPESSSVLSDTSTTDDASSPGTPPEEPSTTQQVSTPSSTETASTADLATSAPSATPTLSPTPEPPTTTATPSRPIQPSSTPITVTPTALATATPTPPASQSPTPLPTPGPSAYYPGTYAIGQELPAGEYVLLNARRFELSSAESFDPDAIVAVVETQGRTYLDLQEGQWLRFSSGTLYTEEQAPAVGDYPLGAGMYKAGTDLPVGEYILLAEQADLEVLTDARWDGSGFPTPMDNRVYVTLRSGEYLRFTAGELLDEAPEPGPGDLPQGMYKIGTDLPSGSYTLRVPPGQHGFYTVYDATTHPLLEHIVDGLSGSITGDTEITVEAGQYLDVSRAVILVP